MLMGGAQVAPLVRPCPGMGIARQPSFFLLLLVLLTSGGSGSGGGAMASIESDALLKFKSSLANTDALSGWNLSTVPCTADSEFNWNGVLCFHGNVWGLQLDNMNLMGEIDVDALLSLPYLRILSLMNNSFEGPMPGFRKLGALRALLLSDNQFRGPIPDDAFMDMDSLKKVYLGNNGFSGNIPTSLAASPRLSELKLQNNHFVGPIPDFPPDLKLINVSNNQLAGPIPTGLANMNPLSFAGNKDLCGMPLKTRCDSTLPASTPPPSPGDVEASASPPSKTFPFIYIFNPTSVNLSGLRTITIMIAAFILLVAIIAVLVIFCMKSPLLRVVGQTPNSYGEDRDRLVIAAASSTTDSRRRRRNQIHCGLSRKKSLSVGKTEHGGGELTFVRDIDDDEQRFDLQDLLRAGAEVLGSGSFGSSYKAVIPPDGEAVVVVKMFKQMNNMGREEFEEHMRRLGRLRHPNLLPLLAYYYRKEEKLLVFDYVQNGSLASQLHGKHSPALGWPTRLKIIKGVVKGLAYLHDKLPSLIVPHGHLKSSNVLLDKSFEPLLIDYTLVPMVNIEQAQHLMVAYKSPEYSSCGRTTKKTDVWCLGILILEVLTGRLPTNFLVHGIGYSSDLANWVESIVREESSGVFDKEMGNTRESKEEMLKLLKIGVGCCEEDWGKRWSLKEAVDKIEGLKVRDSDQEEEGEHRPRAAAEEEAVFERGC